MVAAETGQFVNIARNETDRGVFTVQTTDTPSSSLRRRKKRSGKSPQKLQRINATLEPIHEDKDELHDLEISESEQMSDSTSPTTPESDGVSTGQSSFRLDTPARRSKTKELLLDLDTFEEELDNVPDITVDTDIVNVLSGLPPRPKCKRKVLPPSVTGNSNNDSNADMNKHKRSKVLKLRKDLDRTLETTKRLISRNTQIASYRQKLEPLSETSRPKSTENKVCVFRLSDLSSTNSSSVPDLPSIMNRLANERLDASHLRSLTRLSMRHSDGELCTNTDKCLLEDSGALSTPRRSPISNATDETLSSSNTSKNESCLRGSDLTSFYHMWDRDRNSRPFDKKDNGKFKLNVHRDCLCAIKNCTRACFDKTHSVLPPISSPSKMSS